jgi:hypothetical protein
MALLGVSEWYQWHQKADLMGLIYTLGGITGGALRKGDEARVGEVDAKYAI